MMKIEDFKNIHLHPRRELPDSVYPGTVIPPQLESFCLIIGNGPSAADIDYEKVRRHGCTLIGTNRAWELADLDYLVAFDHPQFEHDAIWLNQVIFTCEHGQVDPIVEGKPNVVRLNRMDSYDVQIVPPVKGDRTKHRIILKRPLRGYLGFSTELEDGVFVSRSVVHGAIQIAHYMGFREIFITGLDLTNDYGNKFYPDGPPMPDEAIRAQHQTFGYDARVAYDLNFTINTVNELSQCTAFDRVSVGLFMEYLKYRSDGNAIGENPVA